MFASKDGSLERPFHCKSIVIEETQQGGTGCGMFLYIGFALMFGGMGLISVYEHERFEQRSEVVEAVVVQPVGRQVEFTPADGQPRRLVVSGKGPLQEGGVRVRWSGAGKGGVLLEEEEFQLEAYREWAVVVAAGLMCLHVLFLMRAWARDAQRRQRLRKLAQRLPAKRWEVRRFRSGNFDRHQVRVVFQAPDGRHFQVDSEEFNIDPEPRMGGRVPQVLLDPDRPEYSVVAMDSLPSTLGV